MEKMKQRQKSHMSAKRLWEKYIIVYMRENKDRMNRDNYLKFKKARDEKKRLNN